VVKVKVNVLQLVYEESYILLWFGCGLSTKGLGFGSLVFSGVMLRDGGTFKRRSLGI
jgi:hypothetical protein